MERGIERLHKTGGNEEGEREREKGRKGREICKQGERKTMMMMIEVGKSFERRKGKQ